MLDIPVLISGGGPVGLTASLLLSRYGIPSLLVERHPSTALTPKARGIRFVPAPKPSAAREKTSARSPRPSPSSASSGFRNTLNA